jgi:hypothetical protein
MVTVTHKKNTEEKLRLAKAGNIVFLSCLSTNWHGEHQRVLI